MFILRPDLAGCTRMPNEHVPTEWLAEYSKGILPEPRLGEVEEHLLVCEQCRQQLNQFDDRWGLNG
ncbi:MAG TPA: hypothetical protein VIX89_16420 [Bryobacteraceae bacterium]